MPTGFPKNKIINFCVLCNTEFETDHYAKYCEICKAKRNYCQCGCGQLCKNKFVSGHNNKGIKFSDKHRNRISLGNKGKKNSLQTRKRIKRVLRKMYKMRKLNGIKHWNWIEFEKRSCLCGCGRIFECKITSKKHYYASGHAHIGKPSHCKKHLRKTKLRIAKKMRKFCKGKTWKERYDLTNKEYEEMKKKRNLTKTGKHPHTFESKRLIGKASRKTILRSYELGRFKFINTFPHRRLVAAMKKTEIWNKEWKNEYSFYYRNSVDIANNKKKIAIFVDGDYWHANLIKYRPSDIFKLKKQVTAQDIWEKDKQVTEFVLSKGWEVLRFWESTILKNPDYCIDKIKCLLKEIEKTNFKRLKDDSNS
jgi:DNA mismatch endonuclease (patch repair protein)